MTELIEMTAVTVMVNEAKIVWWFSAGLMWWRFAVVYPNQLPVAYAKGSQACAPSSTLIF